MTPDVEAAAGVVVGAGAAGVGVQARERGTDADAVLLDREGVGASFERWPAEMRFITPSFPSNGFGIPDLNAIAPRTSPAVGLDRQQLSGREYAEYCVSSGYVKAVDADGNSHITHIGNVEICAGDGASRR